MIDDLIAFLRARLDDDERKARAAAEHDQPPWVNRVGPDSNGYNEGRILDDYGFTVVHVEDQTPEPATADHIVHWHPGRVLAEVEAKQRIVDECARKIRRGRLRVEQGGDDELTPGMVSLALAVLPLLALPYTGHPEYREEWRPAAE